MTALLAGGCVSLRSPLDEGPRDGSPEVAVDVVVVDAGTDGATFDQPDAGRDAGFDRPDAVVTDTVLVDTARDIGDVGDAARCGAPNAACCPADTGVPACDESLECREGRCVPCALICDGQCVGGDNLFHCGGCDNRCALPSARAVCSNGQCLIGACDVGFGDCDNNAANGCETNLQADPGNCGRCGLRCTLANTTDRTCRMGLCGFNGCTPGTADCNGNVADGCEVNLTDVDHCGGCARICTVRDHATRTCMGNECGFSCAANFADCDADAMNGCETDTRTTEAHCGRCGMACVTGQLCTAGACACPAGQTLCNGGACATLATSLSHCGACGRSCATDPNGEARCTDGACSLVCNAGFALSGGRCVQCGLLGNPACSTSPTCATGLSVCSGVCRDRSNDDARCGGCSTVCTAVQRCVSGMCAPCGGNGQPCCRTGTACTSGTCTSGVCA